MEKKQLLDVSDNATSWRNNDVLLETIVFNQEGEISMLD
jgi:hypothetical protein